MSLFNPVIISITVMIILCLLKLNVILSLLISAIVAGITANLSVGQTMSLLIDGMGGNSETALSYLLLGALAVTVNKTGLSTILAKKISKVVKENKFTFILIIAVIACFSQNLIPVHIAFIPILIPALIPIMNKLKIDRRAVACALTFGLKAPYIAIPLGFGLIFQNIIRDQMIANNIEVTTGMVSKVMWIPGVAMIIGLLIAIFFTYRKPREYKNVNLEEFSNDNEDTKMTKIHWTVLMSAIVAFMVQILTGSLPLGGLCAIIVLIVTRTIKFNEIDNLMNGGIKIMGFIAFVMLVAAGYGNVLRETGAIESFVNSIVVLVGQSQFLGALLMLLVGLLITMGIGSSFGTIPILATIYCPLGLKLGFSPLSIIILIGVAGALGDAGSPASDSTLGPTSGLNIDSQHDHIWDTCVPTFLHYNIPLFIFGLVAALIF
ncbi:Na+/H+ antiporter family protein [Clostridium senegalense]|uniref:Na+/H+ antiporter family protein n=1 Tax=Clostridium senegalense TaxID=1465809 RepID=UPI001C125EFD|nr:Na+/H+ antiporter family protein [Clostridium senegalense]MBU5228034.1 Na+/H+ antiporter family protein [Clostridium senegalense]